MSDKVKSAFVLMEKQDSIASEKMWDDLKTAVPMAISRMTLPSVVFIGHCHTNLQKRSVFETVDKTTLSKDFLFGALQTNLKPLGYVQYPSEKEYNIAKNNFQDSESSN